MKSTSLSTTLLFSLLCILLLPATAQQQTWRSADGLHSFAGEFVSLQNNTVTLKGTDGVEVNVPLDRLDVESRTRAQTASISASGVLFEHKTDTYRLILTSGNTLGEIQFYERGQPIRHPPITINAQHHEIEGRTWRHQSIQELVGPIQRDGDQVTWEGRFVNGSTMKIIFDLKPDGFTFAYNMNSNVEESKRSSFRITLSVPPLLTYNEDIRMMAGFLAPEGVPTDRIAALVEPFTLRHRGYRDKSTTTLNYAEAVEGSISGRESIELCGPFASGSIEFYGPSSQENGSYHMWFYDGGRPLYEGIGIRTARPRDAKDSDMVGDFGIRFK